MQCQFSTHPRLPRNTWYALGSDDQKAWDMLTDGGKAQILKDLRASQPFPGRHDRSLISKPRPTNPPSGRSLPHHHPSPGTQDVEYHDFIDDFKAFQAFCEGRRSANVTETQEFYDTNGDEANDDENEDLLQAFLAKNQPTPKAPNTPRKPEKPRAGNINCLLSKEYSKS